MSIDILGEDGHMFRRKALNTIGVVTGLVSFSFLVHYFVFQHAYYNFNIQDSHATYIDHRLLSTSNDTMDFDPFFVKEVLKQCKRSKEMTGSFQIIATGQSEIWSNFARDDRGWNSFEDWIYERSGYMKYAQTYFSFVWILIIGILYFIFVAPLIYFMSCFDCCFRSVCRVRRSKKKKFLLHSFFRNSITSFFVVALLLAAFLFGISAVGWSAYATESVQDFKCVMAEFGLETIEGTSVAIYMEGVIEKGHTMAFVNNQFVEVGPDNPELFAFQSSSNSRRLDVFENSVASFPTYNEQNAFTFSSLESTTIQATNTSSAVEINLLSEKDIDTKFYLPQVTTAIRNSIKSQINVSHSFDKDTNFKFTNNISLNINNNTIKNDVLNIPPAEVEIDNLNESIPSNAISLPITLPGLDWDSISPFFNDIYISSNTSVYVANSTRNFRGLRPLIASLQELAYKFDTTNEDSLVSILRQQSDTIENVTLPLLDTIDMLSGMSSMLKSNDIYASGDVEVHEYHYCLLCSLGSDYIDNAASDIRNTLLSTLLELRTGIDDWINDDDGGLSSISEQLEYYSNDNILMVEDILHDAFEYTMKYSNIAETYSFLIICVIFLITLPGLIMLVITWSHTWAAERQVTSWRCKTHAAWIVTAAGSLELLLAGILIVALTPIQDACRGIDKNTRTQDDWQSYIPELIVQGAYRFAISDTLEVEDLSRLSLIGSHCVSDDGDGDFLKAIELSSLQDLFSSVQDTITSLEAIDVKSMLQRYNVTDFLQNNVINDDIKNLFSFMAPNIQLALSDNIALLGADPLQVTMSTITDNKVSFNTSVTLLSPLKSLMESQMDGIPGFESMIGDVMEFPGLQDIQNSGSISDFYFTALLNHEYLSSDPDGSEAIDENSSISDLKFLAAIMSSSNPYFASNLLWSILKAKLRRPHSDDMASTPSFYCLSDPSLATSDKWLKQYNITAEVENGNKTLSREVQISLLPCEYPTMKSQMDSVFDEIFVSARDNYSNAEAKLLSAYDGILTAVKEIEELGRSSLSGLDCRPINEGLRRSHKAICHGVIDSLSFAAFGLSIQAFALIFLGLITLVKKKYLRYNWMAFYNFDPKFDSNLSRRILVKSPCWWNDSLFSSSENAGFNRSSSSSGGTVGDRTKVEAWFTSGYTTSKRGALGGGGGGISTRRRNISSWVPTDEVERFIDVENLKKRGGWSWGWGMCMLRIKYFHVRWRRRRENWCVACKNGDARWDVLLCERNMRLHRDIPSRDRICYKGLIKESNPTTCCCMSAESKTQVAVQDHKDKKCFRCHREQEFPLSLSIPYQSEFFGLNENNSRLNFNNNTTNNINENDGDNDTHHLNPDVVSDHPERLALSERPPPLTSSLPVSLSEDYLSTRVLLAPPQKKVQGTDGLPFFLVKADEKHFVSPPSSENLMRLGSLPRVLAPSPASSLLAAEPRSSGAAGALEQSLPPDDFCFQQERKESSLQSMNSTFSEKIETLDNPYVDGIPDEDSELIFVKKLVQGQSKAKKYNKANIFYRNAEIQNYGGAKKNGKKKIRWSSADLKRNPKALEGWQPLKVRKSRSIIASLYRKQSFNEKSEKNDLSPYLGRRKSVLFSRHNEEVNQEEGTVDMEEDHINYDIDDCEKTPLINANDDDDTKSNTNRQRALLITPSTAEFSSKSPTSIEPIDKIRNSAGTISTPRSGTKQSVSSSGLVDSNFDVNSPVSVASHFVTSSFAIEVPTESTVSLNVLPNKRLLIQAPQAANEKRISDRNQFNTISFAKTNGGGDNNNIDVDDNEFDSDSSSSYEDEETATMIAATFLSFSQTKEYIRLRTELVEYAIKVGLYRRPNSEVLHSVKSEVNRVSHIMNFKSLVHSDPSCALRGQTLYPSSMSFRQQSSINDSDPIINRVPYNAAERRKQLVEQRQASLRTVSDDWHSLSIPVKTTDFADVNTFTSFINKSCTCHSITVKSILGDIPLLRLMIESKLANYSNNKQENDFQSNDNEDADDGASVRGCSDSLVGSIIAVRPSALSIGGALLFSLVSQMHEIMHPSIYLSRGIVINTLPLDNPDANEMKFEQDLALETSMESESINEITPKHEIMQEKSGIHVSFDEPLDDIQCELISPSEWENLQIKNNDLNGLDEDPEEETGSDEDDMDERSPLFLKTNHKGSKSSLSDKTPRLKRLVGGISAPSPTASIFRDISNTPRVVGLHSPAVRMASLGAGDYSQLGGEMVLPSTLVVETLHKKKIYFEQVRASNEPLCFRSSNITFQKKDAMRGITCKYFGQLIHAQVESQDQNDN